MKRLVVLFSCLFFLGCGDKKEPNESADTGAGPVIDNSTEQSEGETGATVGGDEISDLPVLPEEITEEFIMGLWAKPHDGRDLIKELADVSVREGVWKVVITTGPDKKEMIHTSEASMIVKMVDRRFQVWQWSVGEDVEYSFLTYDSDAEKYRWWGVLADGFIMEWSGRRYWRNLVEWNTVKTSVEGLAMTIRETRIAEDRKKLEMTGTMKQGDEVVAYRKDEFTWLSELPEEHRLSEVK